MLIFFYFIQVYVFTTNHHLNIRFTVHCSILEFIVEWKSLIIADIAKHCCFFFISAVNFIKWLIFLS